MKNYSGCCLCCASSQSAGDDGVEVVSNSFIGRYYNSTTRRQIAITLELNFNFSLRWKCLWRKFSGSDRYFLRFAAYAIHFASHFVFAYNNHNFLCILIISLWKITWKQKSVLRWREGVKNEFFSFQPAKAFLFANEMKILRKINFFMQIFLISALP